MSKTTPENKPKADADLIEFGFEVDPDVDSLGKAGAPGAASPAVPGKPIDYTGITFPSKEAVAAWLKHSMQRFLDNEQVVLAEEQQVPSPYKAYAILTTSRLILVKTHPARPPDIWVYNPKLLVLRAVVLGIVNADGKVVERVVVPGGARPETLRSTYRNGVLDAAFEPVRPMPSP